MEKDAPDEGRVSPRRSPGQPKSALAQTSYVVARHPSVRVWPLTGRAQLGPVVRRVAGPGTASCQGRRVV